MQRKTVLCVAFFVRIIEGTYQFAGFAYCALEQYIAENMGWYHFKTIAQSFHVTEQRVIGTVGIL